MRYPCGMSRLLWSLALLVAAAGPALAGEPAASTHLVYVSAEDSGEILAVDVDKAEVAARIPVGKRPRGIKVSPDGKLLYVALSGSPRGGPGVDES
jgi:YVTN family beta-propeller protein